MTFIAFIIGYNKYQESKREAAELEFHAKAPWKWHKKLDGVQIQTKNGKSTLRKVYLNQKLVVFATLDDNYKLIATAVFEQKCRPNSLIVTTQKFSSGEQKILRCLSSGAGLFYSTTFANTSQNYDITWDEDLDGFKVHTDFSFWNFDKLRQEVTMNKQFDIIKNK